MSVVKRGAKRVLGSLGIEVRRTRGADVDPLCEAFDLYAAEAAKAGLDVNDWIEERLGWEPALPMLQDIVFPLLRRESVVCEVGAGTGRHARHLASRIDSGALHLFDHSPWVRKFLKGYFAASPNVSVEDSNGVSIARPNGSVDLCFSNGTFIELQLGTIFLLAREFSRILRGGGYAVFDYLDAATPGGWRYLEERSADHHRTYSYHDAATIDKVFAGAGLVPAARHHRGKSTYAVFCKA